MVNKTKAMVAEKRKQICLCALTVRNAYDVLHTYVFCIKTCITGVLFAMCTVIRAKQCRPRRVRRCGSLARK